MGPINESCSSPAFFRAKKLLLSALPYIPRKFNKKVKIWEDTLNSPKLVRSKINIHYIAADIIDTLGPGTRRVFPKIIGNDIYTLARAVSSKYKPRPKTDTDNDA